MGFPPPISQNQFPLLKKTAHYHNVLSIRSLLESQKYIYYPYLYFVIDMVILYIFVNIYLFDSVIVMYPEKRGPPYIYP